MKGDDKLTEIENWINRTRERLFNHCDTVPITPATLSDMEYLLNKVRHLQQLIQER